MFTKQELQQSARAYLASHTHNASNGPAMLKLVDRLASLETDKRYRKPESFASAVKRLCETEVERLRVAYGLKAEVEGGIEQDIKSGSTNSLHAALTEFRALITHVFAGSLDDRNSYSKIVGGLGKRHEDRYHLALRWLVKSEIERVHRGETTNRNRLGKVADRQSYTISPGVLLSKAASVLATSNSYAALILAVQAFTGRRHVEIAITGNFEVVDPDTIRFSGQAKTRDDERSGEGYLIPILNGKASEVAAAVAKIRALKDFGAMLDNKDFNRICAKTIKEAYTRYFDSVMPQGLPPKSLRAAYGAIAYSRHGGARDERVYLAGILGHGADDDATAGFYSCFRVAAA